MRTKDGIELVNDTPEGIVAELHKLSNTQHATDVEFMRELAGRVSLQFGRKVSTRTAAEFVGSLVAIGLLLDD